MSGRRLVTLGLLFVAACGTSSVTPPAGHGPVPAGAVARVGDDVIESSAVQATAAARRLSPADALAAVIDDAVAAQAARARGLDKSPLAARAIRAALARSVVEHTKTEARRTPISDTELREIYSERWAQVDSPEQRVVVHAVVQPPKDTKPAQDVRGRAVAEAIARAVATAKTAADFEAAAKAVEPDGHTVTVEGLPAFVADGRAVDGSTFDKDFAAAAFAVHDVGGTSSPAQSSFGWHVIRVVERIPPHEVPWGAREALFADDILRTRAKESFDATLASRRKATSVEIATGADALLGSLAAAAAR